MDRKFYVVRKLSEKSQKDYFMLIARSELYEVVLSFDQNIIMQFADMKLSEMILLPYNELLEV